MYQIKIYLSFWERIIEMQKVVEVEIKYSDKDIKQAISYVIIHINMIWICLLACPVVAIGTILYGLVCGFNNNINVLVVIFLLLSLIIYAMYYQMPINRYIDFYRKRKGGTYIFSSEQIEIVGEDIQSVCAWSLFKKACDIPAAFLLTDDNGILYIFPKYLFKSSEDVQTVQQFICENIKNFKISKK